MKILNCGLSLHSFRLSFIFIYQPDIQKPYDFVYVSPTADWLQLPRPVRYNVWHAEARHQYL